MPGKDQDGDYMYQCSIGHEEWPAYLNAVELAVFLALVDEEFRALMVGANWNVDACLEHARRLQIKQES